MDIETFDLERQQSLWENQVKYNLTESGIHPFTLPELLTKSEIDQLSVVRLGYGQTNGSPELREAISQLYVDGTCHPDNILVTNGSAEANFINIWSNLSVGDELILMQPNYNQILGLARSWGIKVIPFNLYDEQNWHPDLTELDNLISSKTKMIALCNPNNPTGAILNQKEMEEIVGIAQRGDVWIYVDEIYRGAEYNEILTPSFWSTYPKAIVTWGLSKSFALPGLRIGWMVGPKDIIARAWRFSDYTTITTGILSNRIATLVLQPERMKSIFSRNRKYIQSNLAILKKWVDKHGTLFYFVPPHAGGIAFLHYDLKVDSHELTTKLREEKSVFIVAGSYFGSSYNHYLRIGLGSKKKYFMEGLSLITEFLREYYV